MCELGRELDESDSCSTTFSTTAVHLSLRSLQLSYQYCTTIAIMQPLQILLGMTFCLTPAMAQFQFFDQMFGGGPGHHHEQQPQNAASDSAWYKQNYEAGEY